MAVSSSFPFFVFLFHLLLRSVESSSCSSYCPGLGSLDFPLFDNQPDCGLFRVNCTTSSYPLIRLAPGGTWYEIIDRISASSFRLRDPQRQDQLTDRSCFSLFNLSLPSTPSTSFTISPSITVFQCFNGSQDEVFRAQNFGNYSCRDYTVYYRDPRNGTDGPEISIPRGCKSIQLPRSPNLNSSNLFDLLTAEFTLDWNISADCMRCHERGGQCSTNSMSGFLCRTTPERSQTTVILAAAIAGGAFLLTMLILATLWWKCCCSQHKDTLEYELRGFQFRTSSFSYQQIKAATNSFSSANKIGEGGFGPVHKGTLSDGTVVAVKQLSARSRQGNREFVTEIGLISALRHPNLVKLYGCCVQGNNLLLIYEYMENNSLARALFGPGHYKMNMDWPSRYKICLGVAKGLAYLHEESALKIVHRDIKASNVLLDGKLNPKISDFGLARLHEGDNTHISTRIAGTLGYMAPEYAMNGYLTEKADIYSFGVLLLEVISGRSNTSMIEELNLLEWARSLSQRDKLMELVDPRLRSSCNREEILASINTALSCTNFVAAERPSMSSVVSMLGGSSREGGSDVYLSLSGPRIRIAR